MKKKFLCTALAVTTVISGLFFLTGCGKNDDKKNESADSASTSSLATYITKEGDKFIFIDANGKVVKLSESTLGSDFSANSNTYYPDSLYVKKEKGDDTEYSLVDFNGKTLYKSDNYLTRVTASDKGNTYYFRNEDRKYGVIDSTGKEIIPAEYGDYFKEVYADFDYLYTNEYNSADKNYTIYTFNTKGEKVFTHVADDDNPYTYKTETVGDGNEFVIFKQDSKTSLVVNLASGEIVQEVVNTNESERLNVELSTTGNCLIVTTYNGSIYSSTNTQKTAYIFGADHKVAQKIVLNSDSASEVSIRDSAENGMTIVKKEIDENTEEYIVYSRYGKEIRKTDYAGYRSVSFFNNYIESTNKTNSLICIPGDSKTYTVINDEGKTILNQKITEVGNNYVLASDKSLYKLDGTKYMENVSKYSTIKDLDLITTSDGKVYLENSKGSKVEVGDTFSSIDDKYMIDNTTLAVKTKKEVVIINTDTLSMNKIDISSYNTTYIKRYGFIECYNQKTYTFFDKTGKQIYTYSY